MTKNILNYLMPTKKFLKKYSPLLIVLIALTVSFVYGWYYDNSKPVSGSGWADQSLYIKVADKLYNGELPQGSELHYAIGYSLLGAIAKIFYYSDPFFLVALLLLLGSATLCYLAVKHLFGTRWALLFSLLLFVWDGMARKLHFASEIFAVPWNNQVLFFAFAFLFWLFVTQAKTKPSYKLVSITGLVAGLAFVTREESILFTSLAIISFLYITKANWKKWILCFGIVIICFMPQVYVKLNATGDISKSGRNKSYTQLREQYLQPYLLYRNSVETFVDSDRFINQPVPAQLEKWCSELAGACVGDPMRKALLPIAPWLILSVLGIPIILYSRRYTVALKIFVLISILLLIFYLSGANMGAYKLKYHSIRYITPAFICLNLAVIVVLRESKNYLLPAAKKPTKNKN